jgi:hypothetical protein
MISFKIGIDEIFKEPLCDLKKNYILTKNLRTNQGKSLMNQTIFDQTALNISNYFHNNNELLGEYKDIVPKFLTSQSKQLINAENIKRLNEKKNILDRIIKSYFKEFKNDNYNLYLEKIETEMRNQEIALNYSNRNDYENFKQLITILTTLDFEGNSQPLQLIQQNDYLNLEKEQYKMIINYISKYRNEILENLGLNNTISSKETNNNNNIYYNPFANNDNKYKNETKVNKANTLLQQYNEVFNNPVSNNNNSNVVKGNSNINNNNKNNFINNDKTYNTSYTFNQKSNIEKKYYKSLLTKFYDPEKFDLFKIMINDQNISNEEISKFLNTFCPNVQQSVEKYYQKKYGASCLTLIYFYPNITNVKKQKILHNFSFIAATNELFLTALLDYSIVNKVRLYTDNKVEIEEINRKIKCIGALNLKNNSIITVVKK